MVAETRIDRVSVGLAALTFALMAAALAPLFFVPIPAMLDYVNHLARMYLLAGHAPSAYEVNWKFCPDLAMDLIVPALARWIGVNTAAKVFVGLSQILVVTGAMYLEWVVKGRCRLGGLGALLVLFSLPLAWGLMNFTFGLGLAAWSVGLWIRLREKSAWVRWIVHAAAVAALFISHLFDLGLYGLTIGLWELSRIRDRPNLWMLSGLAAFMASPVIAALAAVGPAGSGIVQPAFTWAFDLKWRWALIFMNVYDSRLSVLTAAILSAVVVVGFATRRAWLDRAGIWIGAGFLTLYIVLPLELFDSQYQDVRLITTVAVILPAFISTAIPRGLARMIPLALIVGIIAANDASTAWAWSSFRDDYQEFQASFPLLVKGSAVLVAVRDEADRSEYHPIYYAPTLAVPAAGVFVTSFFSFSGMQPVAPRRQYAALSVTDTHDYTPPRISQILSAANTETQSGLPTYLTRWAQRYQYLYLIGPPGQNPLPAQLTLLTTARRFSLYRLGDGGIEPGKSISAVSRRLGVQSRTLTGHHYS